MKYSKEQTIKDLERVIKEFERKGLTKLAEMKREELKKLKEKDCFTLDEMNEKIRRVFKD